MGLSSTGKSALVSPLMRLPDVDAGRICVDDQDVRDVTQTSLQGQIDVVTQDVGLLHRSIRDRGFSRY